MGEQTVENASATTFIKALVAAWDCCGTCAGGVLAKRDRERLDILRDPETLLTIARAIHGNTIGDPAKGEPVVRLERETDDVIRDAKAALAVVANRLGVSL